MILKIVTNRAKEFPVFFNWENYLRDISNFVSRGDISNMVKLIYFFPPINNPFDEDHHYCNSKCINKITHCDLSRGIISIGAAEIEFCDRIESRIFAIAFACLVESVRMYKHS